MKASSNSKKERLWLGLHFPDLPFNALGFTDHALPLVVAQKQRVFFATDYVQEKGVVTGMDITSAQVLSQCEVHERDKTLELHVLQQLTETLYQFTPYIELHHSDRGSALLLEISQCLKLFNGLLALCSQVFTLLGQSPFRYKKALAHTAKGAYLLSQYDYEPNGKESKDLFIQRLSAIPLSALEALEECPKAVSALTKSGFNTLGDVARQIDGKSISSIRTRAGERFTQVFCEIFAIEQSFQQGSLFEKPRQVYQPANVYVDSLQFDYPVSQLDQLKPAVELLLTQFSEYLRKAQRECQHIQWQLMDNCGHSQNLEVTCDQPQSHGDLLYELTCLKLDHQVLAFTVDSLQLRCEQTTVVHNRAQSLSFATSSNRATEQEFSLSLAKLNIILGDSAVYKMHYHDSHIPEQSNKFASPSEYSNENLPAIVKHALRPTWLFYTPQPIQQKKQGLYWQGYLSLLSKAERIETHWWDKPVTRDYFLAQRQDYLRVWVFLDLHQQKWYVHGIFA